jgi:hypothetical protein
MANGNVTMSKSTEAAVATTSMTPFPSGSAVDRKKSYHLLLLF